MARRTFPAPETVFPKGYEWFKAERVPMFEEWGWVAHHPQFIFHPDNYAQTMYDMFNAIHTSGAADDPESPWYPYVQDFLDLRARGKFDPEGRLNMVTASDAVVNKDAAARRAKQQAVKEVMADAAAPRPAPAPEVTHCCGDVREEQGTLPPQKAKLKRGAAVPEGSLW